jgi:hypothetical protein
MTAKRITAMIDKDVIVMCFDDTKLWELSKDEFICLRQALDYIATCPEGVLVKRSLDMDVPPILRGK